MSIARPQNRDEFRQYILTKLGAPVLQVNVSEEQIDIAIEDAFQYFNERSHFLGTERMYLTFRQTPEFIDIDVVIFMLPNGRIVSDMANKLLEMNLKSVFIDMSSSDPRETQELGKKLKKTSVKFLDAPVSGGVARAKTGDLMIMAGGDEKLLEEVNDLLSVMGKVQFAGPLGSGHAIKALNNYMSAAGLIASFEALATARSFGINPENFLNIINGATGKNNTTEVKLDKFVISEKFNSGFALDLMVKDVKIANNLIKNLSSEKPLSNDVLSHLSEALRTLEGNPDHTEVYKAIKK